MKIKTEYGHLIDIFGIYWVLSIDNSYAETILLGLPKGNGGLTTFRITGELVDKVEIIDPIIPANFMYINSGLYHRALIEENLLDNIIEYDEDAYNRFLEIIKSEGLVEPDFY
ncbi:hypothetical protein RHO15_06485 [Utexia brackfieldae]|uniref:hypothetical protein n=1 Tax=Utexia brackfieldae TaxID=3074108 RepID=UPI00370DDA15